MKLFLATLVGMALVTSNALAEAKFGYIDMQKAIQQTKAGQKAKSDLEKEVETRKKELQAKEKDIKKMGEDFEKKSAVLSDEVRSKKQMEIQEEMMKWRELAQKPCCI